MIINKTIISYVLIFFCAFSVQALANVATQDNGPLASFNISDNITYRETLKKAFNKAPSAEVNDVLGWTSGRCYDIHAQNVPKNILIAGAKFDLNGPELPYIHKVTAIRYGGGPDYFDNFMEDEAAARKVESLINNLYKSIEGSVQKDGTLLGYSGQTTLTLRKGEIMQSNEKYLLAATTHYNNFEYVKDYCYFFKQVKN